MTTWRTNDDDDAISDVNWSEDEDEDCEDCEGSGVGEDGDNCIECNGSGTV